MSLSERANIDFINDLRFWSGKYYQLSNLIAINAGFFSYQIMRTKLYWYIAAPLAFTTAFITRNVVMRNVMNRIYYASESTYTKFREDELRPQKLKEE